MKSRISETQSLVAFIHGFPKQILGSTEIRSKYGFVCIFPSFFKLLGFVPQPNLPIYSPNSFHLFVTFSIISDDMLRVVPHSLVVSAPILFVASIPIFPPSSSLGDAKSR